MKKEYEGLQNKEKDIEGWVKYDKFGYEGLSEVLSYRFSKLLSTRLSFCEYMPIKNIKGTGCFSKSVVTENETLISLYSFFPEEPKSLNANHLFMEINQIIIFSAPRIAASVVRIRKAAKSGFITIINRRCSKPGKLE
mgnify:CR=1 FL=1